MAAKRRHSKVADQLKKNKKVKNEQGSKDDELYELLKSTLSLAMGLRDGSRMIKTQFLKLPSSKLYPDYYEKIQNPISLSEIKAKVEGRNYSDVDEFVADFKLLSDNASTYNLKESLIAQDAENIFNFVNERVNQNKEPKKIKLRIPKKAAKEEVVDEKEEDEEKEKEKEKEKEEAITAKDNFLEKPLSADIKAKLLGLLDSLMNYEVKKQTIADVFLEEPSRKLYPDYYQIIQHPVSITTIKRNINNRKTQKYGTVKDFVKDVNLMWRNAKTYNEEGSIIVNYANTLSKVFEQDIKEVAANENSYVPDISSIDSQPQPKHTTPDTKSRPLKLKLQTPRPPEPPAPRRRGRPKKNAVVDASRSGSRHDKDRLSSTVAIDNIVAADFKQERTPEISHEMDTPMVDNITKEDVLPDATQIQEVDMHPSRKVKDGDHALIKWVSIFSSRPKFANNTQRVQYGQPNSDAQFSHTVFQNWFEYQFEAKDYRISNYSLSLPVFNNVSNKGSITILATLRDDLIDKKYSNVLTVNDERVKPSPSITYADSDKVLTSRYDLKLALGLNNVKLFVKVLGNGPTDLNSGIDNTNIITNESQNTLPQETVNFWINVCQ